MRLEIEQNVASVPFSNDLQPESGSSESGIDIERLLKQGVSAAQSGERGLARTLLFRVTEADPRNADAWLWLASISEYPEELLGFLDNVLDIDPDNFRARQWKSATRSLLAKTFVQRGVSANDDGQTDFALNCFEKAIEYDARCESAWLWKASLAFSEQDRVQFLEHVLELNPENEDAIIAMDEISNGRIQAKMSDARSAAVRGDHPRSEELLDEILASDPDSVEAWSLKSQVAQPFEEKLVAYRRVFELDPTNIFARGGYEFLADLIDEVNETDSQDPAADHMTSDPSAAAESDSSLDLDFASEHFETESQSDGDAFSDETETPEMSEYAPTAMQGECVEANEELYVEESSVGTSDVDVASEASVEDENPQFAEQLWASESEVSEQPQQSNDPVFSPSDANEEYTNEFVEEERFATNDDEELPAQIDEPASDEAHSDEYPWYYAKADEEVSASEEVPVGDDESHQDNYAEVAAPSEEVVSVETLEITTPSAFSCPFCGGANEPHAFECSACNAALSLSDIDSLLNNSRSNWDVIHQSVTQMEAEWNLREFNENELTILGIGQLNLKNNEKGIAYLQEASRLNPNNVILSGQINAIAIRLDETRRQTEIFESMPKGKSILVVDDSATVRKLISSKLEKSGHNVVTAVDGVEAMEKIESMTPDLVLLDIAMPRMDGYSVCKLIRSNEKTKDVPVVMISGKDGFFDKVRGRMAGTTGYITKPFGPETLMRALETYLLPDQVSAD